MSEIKQVFEAGFYAGARVVQRYGRANSGLRLDSSWSAYQALSGEPNTSHAPFSAGYNASTLTVGTYDSEDQMTTKFREAWAISGLGN